MEDKQREGVQPQESRNLNKRQPKQKVSKFAALAIGGFIIITTIFLLFKGKSPKGTCHYDHVYRKVTCKTKQLLSIPEDVPEGALSLDMGNKYDKVENTFTTLIRANFSRFRHLQELKLVKCGVRDIEEGTFADLTNLRTLDLRYNRISTVDGQTFKGLTSVDHLYLSNNPITHLSDHTFRGIRVENLILANNPTLSHISKKAFAGAIFKTLVLNRCSLAGLEEDTFWHISDSLQELHLTNNLQPLNLPKTIFKGLTFKVLTLDNNGIKDEDFLENAVAEEINLDDNPLGDLDLEDAPNLIHTKRLSLSNTGQEELAAEDFIHLENLEELDLEDNSIDLLNMSDLANMKRLKILDVSRNDLIAVSGDFNALGVLESLYIDDNELRTLPADMEALLSRLKSFTVHSNPLHCNCELQWFVNWLRDHKELVHEAALISCTTPVATNFTDLIGETLHCGPPTILNATFDSDGISLVCTGEGDPAPVVSWESEDGKLNKTAIPLKYRKDVTQTTCSLAISRDGNFTCTVSNVAGTDRIVIDTKHISTSGIKYAAKSEKIQILETPQGFFVTVCLICILGYILRYSEPDSE